MYKVEKRFTLSIGHRLSKHSGLCKNIHGHNLNILVGVKRERLNLNDMVIDFSDLKDLVNDVLQDWDHALLLGADDYKLTALIESDAKVRSFPFDPTAERLGEVLFFRLRDILKEDFNVELEYVTICENENSKATYCK